MSFEVHLGVIGDDDVAHITMHMFPALLNYFIFANSLVANVSSFVMEDQSSVREPTKRIEQRRQWLANSLYELVLCIELTCSLAISVLHKVTLVYLLLFPQHVGFY